MTQGPPPQAGRPGRPDRDEAWDAVSPAQWAGLWDALALDAESHPVDLGTLGEYALLLHRRGPEVAQRALPAVAAHLAAGCPRCDGDLADLLAFAAEELGQAPVSQPGLPAGTSQGGLRRVLAARLTPLRASPSRGLRGPSGASPSPPTLMFQTDDVTVVLRVEQEARRDTVSVNGIVVPRLGDTSPLWGGEARLVALAVPSGPGGPGGDARAERVDAQGGFVLDGVPPGSYNLELRSGDEVVVVEDLQIGAASAGQQRPEGS